MRCKIEISNPSDNSMVLVENLNVTFGKNQIVHDVSFNVKQGEIIGMFGISGAGKTKEIKRIERTCSKFNDKPLKVISVMRTEAWLNGSMSERNRALPKDSGDIIVPEKIMIIINSIKYI
ncbi:unnamed protein product [marine sediment metagenome]|uniref:ABC transporter domain-containing protein n=1 Tax=marine sediment metagenome TaxID=412755 RepID=X1TUP6_9ZZZZ